MPTVLRARARQAIVDICASRVPKEGIIESNVWHSELSKLKNWCFIRENGKKEYDTFSIVRWQWDSVVADF